MRSTSVGAPAAHAHGPMSAILAGLLAVAVSYAGPLLIFFQAAHAGNMSPEMTTSSAFAISSEACSMYLTSP